MRDTEIDPWPLTVRVRGKKRCCGEQEPRNEAMYATVLIDCDRLHCLPVIEVEMIFRTVVCSFAPDSATSAMFLAYSAVSTELYSTVCCI